MPVRSFTEHYLATDQREGEQVSAAALALAMRMIDGMHGATGRIKVRLLASGIEIDIDNWPLRNAWVAGIEFTGLDTDPDKPYIWCDRAEPAAYESAQGPTTVDSRRTCPSHIEIFEKADLKISGPPHVPGM
jgi:hypothetical protein